MTKTAVVILFVIFSLSISAYGADLNIAYVDFNRALNESEQGKKATAVLEDMIKDKKTAVIEKEEEIKKLDEELKKQLSILSPEAREEKEDNLKKLVRDAQRMTRDFQEEVKKKEADLTREIQKEILQVINKVAQEEGYTIVFERGVSGILYFQEQFDITNKVIEKYNESVNKKK
ncbi:OmpH family outer membrane protein [bacterium]|nr:MAG: OmpH family outer membrane protein [bacterium]